jgi:hypothetical protein
MQRHMNCMHADKADEDTLFMACLRGAWLPMQAAVKKPLIQCTSAPKGVSVRDYERHVACAPPPSLCSCAQT